MIKTPKQRYQSSKQDLGWHAELVNSQAWERAKDAAMLAVVTRIIPSDSPITAAANWNRIEGAIEFLKTFENLSALPPDKRSDELPPGQLNHERP